MKAVSTMLVVRDMNRSVEFYKTVLGRKILSDFGANKTLTGGLALQTLDSYRNFIETDRVSSAEISLNCISRQMILMRS